MTVSDLTNLLPRSEFYGDHTFGGELDSESVWSKSASVSACLDIPIRSFGGEYLYLSLSFILYHPLVIKREK